MRKKFTILFVSLVAAVMLSSCENKAESRLFMMDTVIDIRLWGSGAEECLAEAEATLSELDFNLSAYREEGVLFRINSGENVPAGMHLKNALGSALKYSKNTGGAFSPVLGSVIKLWDIGGKNYVPTESEISQALLSAKTANVSIHGDDITLTNGAQLNLGAIAKGYASDVLRAQLEERGISRAVISLGGNVYVRGNRGDGEPWNVALRDPRGDANDWFATLSVSDKFVISSGDYERYFDCDGVRYHHIMDPKTGAPAESDLMAAVVVSESGAQGDAYSTALYVMGRERALNFWRGGSGFELVLIGRDGVVTVTDGLEHAFAAADGRYSYEIARR